MDKFRSLYVTTENVRIRSVSHRHNSNQTTPAQFSCDEELTSCPSRILILSQWDYSTVTDFARFRGLSTSFPRASAA